MSEINVDEITSVLIPDEAKFTVDPIILEKEIDPLETREVQEAAGRYAEMTREIRARCKTMKAGGLGRVLAATAEFPYANSYPKFRSKAETDLFILLISNGKAKSVIANALKDRETELEQIASQEITNQLLEKGKL